MALVGSAHVVVRAITNRVDRDIRDGFRGVEKTGRRAGESLGQAFSRGYSKNVNANVFTRTATAIRTMVPAADQARRSFSGLIRLGLVLGPVISGLIGGITALINGLVGLAGSAGGAIASLAGLGNVLFALISSMIVAKLALSGVGQAISAINQGGGGGGGSGVASLQAIQDAERSLALVIERNRENLIDANNAVRRAQLDLNDALKQGREEIQQLGFDAEDAALAEQRAALALEEARLQLAGVQDLPPNSRARREAELAYQEAELNLRRAKDNSADLNKEQDRLARTGVAGTQVVINATNALAEAQANKSKTVRDAARAEADAEEALARARDRAANAGGGGGSNPYEGLNQAQIDFVNFIVSLKPMFDELSRIAAESFLPKLQEAIELLMKEAYPVVAVGIGLIGSALGDASISLAEAITEGRNLDLLGKLFAATAPLIRTMGVVLGRLYGIFLSILVASAPIAQRYFDYLDEKLGNFDEHLKSVEGNKSLVDFFKLSADAMADWGNILGNIFAAFGAIIQANLGPGSGGQYLLDWLKEVTGGWDAINDTVAGRDDLREFFLVTAVNAQKILSSIGALLGAFKDVSINPNLGIMFDKLAEGAPAFSEMLNKIQDTGPAFADLIVTITDLFNILTDADTGIVFFNTLNTVVTGIRDFLATEFVTGVLDAVAPISGFLLAIGAIGIALTLGGKILTGYVALLFSGAGRIVGAAGMIFSAGGTIAGSFVGAGAAGASLSTRMAILTYSANPLVAAFGRVGFAAATMGKALGKALLGPIGIIIGVIALLVGSFVYLYNTSDQFKAQMDALFGQLMTLFSGVANDILAAIQPLIPVLTGLFTTVINALVPVLVMLAEVFGQIITAIAPLIPLLVGALLQAFVSVLSAILPVVVTIIEALLPAFTAILEAVIPLISILSGRFDSCVPLYR